MSVSQHDDMMSPNNDGEASPSSFDNGANLPSQCRSTSRGGPLSGHDRRTNSAAREPSQRDSATLREHEWDAIRLPPPNGGVSEPASQTPSNGGIPSPAALTRRQRTCVSSLAAVIVYMCWNLRFMSSSLRMLALFPEHDDRNNSNPQPIRRTDGKNGTTTMTNSARGTFPERQAHLSPSPSSPSICLLMSFPNSGTSYTLKNTQLMSGRVVGTNYEAESKTRRPLFEPTPSDDYADEGTSAAVTGPFVVNASFARTNVVLTKTHCNMNADFASFERACHSIRRVVNRTAVEVGPYPMDRVRGAVHLIRSPFDNVVARMHHGINKYRRVLPNATLSTFTNDRPGFLNWCRFLDSTFGNRIRVLLPNATRSILPSIPCHSDFLHYIGWHNFALEFVRVHTLRYHVLHYEDYGADFHATAAKLLEFLDLRAEGDPAPFVAGKSYLDFYVNAERSAIVDLLSRTCTPPLWKLVLRYLPPTYEGNATRVHENDMPLGGPSFFATAAASV